MLCDHHLHGHEVEIVHGEKGKKKKKISLFIMGDDTQNHVRSHAEIKPNN